MGKMFHLILCLIQSRELEIEVESGERFPYDAQIVARRDEETARLRVQHLHRVDPGGTEGSQ